jgi:hypothetical protein
MEAKNGNSGRMEALIVKEKLSNKSRRFESVFVWVAPAALLLSLLAAPRSPQAQLSPTDDTYNVGTNNANHGSDGSLIVKESNSSLTLIRFDLASLPSGITGSAVANATLTLFATAVGTAGTFNVQQVTGSWTEGSVTGATAPALGSVIATGVATPSVDDLWRSTSPSR